MGLFRQWWANEPARFWAALVVFINAVIFFVVVMGWLALDANQLGALYLVVLSAAALVGGEEVRRRVTPTGKEPVDPPEDPGS